MLFQFILKLPYEKTKINEKRTGLVPILKHSVELVVAIFVERSLLTIFEYDLEALLLFNDPLTTFS